MYRYHHQPGILVLLLSVMLSACSSLPTVEHRAHQQAALQRWDRCLDRESNSEGKAVSASRAISVAEQNCEGHKRDVLATYPRHLQKNLSSFLTLQGRERLASRLSEKSLIKANDKSSSITLR